MGQLQGEVHIVKHKVASNEENFAVVDITLKELNGDIDVCEDLDVLREMVENLDSLQRKNIIKVRGLKENIEGEGLVQFLVPLFSNWAGPDSEIDSLPREAPCMLLEDV